MADERYEKRRLLGRGGMGEVWLAHDRELGRDVALKFLIETSPEDLARFKREAHLAGKLSHPNIVAVHDVSDRWLVMDYIPGLPANEASLTPRQAAEIIRQSAEALDYAHAHDVIHRDVKPANILVADGRAFVTDFGLAKKLGADSSLSMSGDIFGTPMYMPPEQALGLTRDVGPRSDIYSLGATLYALLARRAPFTGENAYEVITKVVNDEPAPLPAVDRDLGVIVARAMEKDPARRYASAQALADDLARYLAGEAIEAHSPSMFYRARKKLAKRKALAAALSALILVGAAFGAYAIVQTVHARERERTLKELGGLWSEVLLAHEGIYQPRKTPAEVHRGLVGAEQKVGRFVEAHPNLAQAYYVRAVARLYLNDAPGAEDDLRKATAIEPSFTPGWILLARVILEQYMQSSLETASQEEINDLGPQKKRWLSDAQGALARSARGTDSLAEWGLKDMGEGRVTRLMTNILQTYYIENDLPRATALIEEAVNKEPSEVILCWYAWVAAQDKIASLKRAIEIAPHYAPAHLELGRILLEKKEFVEAAATLDRAIEIDPRGYRAFWLRACVRHDTGDKPGALEDFARAIELRPDRAILYSFRAELEGEIGLHDLAIADSTRAVEINPRYSPGYVSRAKVRIIQGDFDAATKDFDAAVAANPDDAWTLLERQKFRNLRGDLAGAEEDYSRSVRAAATDPDVLVRRASLRLQRGDTKGAVDDCTRAIQLYPDDIKALATRAFAYYELGDLDRSAADFTRCIKVNPRFALHYTHRGFVKAVAGDLAGALADHDRALEIDPTCETALENRAAARLSVGNKEGAVADWEKLLEIAPKHPKAEAFRESIRKARGEF